MSAEPSLLPRELVYSSRCEDGLLFTMDTHPSSDLLATGDVQGVISIYRYAPGADCCHIRQLTHSSTSSCRALKFSRNGRYVFFSADAHGGVHSCDLESGKLVHSVQGAHGCPLYCMHNVSDRLLATGDENGAIKLWDTRTWKEVCHVKENKDFISDMASDDDNTTLLATSGDGSLLSVCLRERKVEGHSDSCESELLSLAIVKGGCKVVCGDGDGVLMIYNWGLWGDITDRYPTYPHSIDSMLQISDRVICLGSMDGIIRSVKVLPTEILGVVGQHSEGLPIDSLCLTHDQNYIVSSNHEGVQFWLRDNVPMLKRGCGPEEVTGRKKKKRRKGNEEGETRTASNNFFADL